MAAYDLECRSFVCIL